MCSVLFSGLSEKEGMKPSVFLNITYSLPSVAKHFHINAHNLFISYPDLISSAPFRGRHIRASWSVTHACLHVLLQYMHDPPLRSSSFPPAW